MLPGVNPEPIQSSEPSPATPPPPLEPNPGAASVPPAPFRLKPRISPASPPSSAVPPPDAPPPPPVSGAADSEQAKFKLKPKMPEAPAGEAPATIPPSPAPAPAPTPTEIPSPAETATVKTIGGVPIVPPPFPLVAAAPDSPARRLPPPVPHVRAPASLNETDFMPPAPTLPANKRLRRLLPAALIVILAIAVFFTYRRLTAPSAPLPVPAQAAPARPAPAKPGAPSAPSAGVTAVPRPAETDGPTPSATLNAIAAAPGNAIAKAQGAVNARRGNEQDRVDALAAGNEPNDARALNTPPPSQLTRGAGAASSEPIKTTSTSEVAPGVTATTTVTSELQGTGSPAFRAWVAAVRINGVFQGPPARALINGRTVRAGQTVDEVLGIVFDRVEADNRSIVFRDASGATIARKY